VRFLTPLARQKSGIHIHLIGNVHVPNGYRFDKVKPIFCQFIGNILIALLVARVHLHTDGVYTHDLKFKCFQDTPFRTFDVNAKIIYTLISAHNGGKWSTWNIFDVFHRFFQKDIDRELTHVMTNARCGRPLPRYRNIYKSMSLTYRGSHRYGTRTIDAALTPWTSQRFNEDALHSRCRVLLS